MAEDFVLSGDPGSISASGRTWGEFSASASTASTAIRGVQAGAVQGDEWTEFTDAINDSLPGHLDTTSDAWSIVSAALITYADKLAGFQQRMSSLKTSYDSQQRTASNAKANLDAAHRSDSAEKTRVSTATAALKPGDKLPASTYVSPTSDAQSSFTEANGNLQATVNSAAQVRKDHSDALQTAVSDVNRAKGMRFQKPPGWFGSMMHSIGGWISDHAAILTKISSVLKTISGICGLLAFIPVVGEVFGAIALVTGGAALLIDVGLKLATGQGSWTQIGLDAFSMIPGARAAKLAYGANVAYTGYNVATGKASITDLVMVTGMGALSMKGGGGKGEKFGGGSEGNRSTKFDEPSSSEGRSRSSGGKEGGDTPDDFQGLDLEVISQNGRNIIAVKYKKGWSHDQIIAADEKVAALNKLAGEGKLVKTVPQRTGVNVRSLYAKTKGVAKSSLPKDKDVDHTHELQLGGKERDPKNLKLLDKSVNRSVGAQIKNHIKDHARATVYHGVTISHRP